MRIFLTGSRGMVGRNVLEHPRATEHEWLSPSRNELDLCDFSAVRAYLDQHRPDYVIHAAGRVGGIQANIQYPVDFLIENLDMGRNVVLAAKEVGIPRLINLGSSCMYPREGENPLSEKQILTGELEPTNEGYALAKIAVARLCQYINQQYQGFAYKTLIPCNLYGRHDKFDPAASHLVPAVIQKIHDACLSQQDSVEIWGDGQARREFMYAGDLADCIFDALDRFDRLPDVANVGLGYDYSINEYYQTVAEMIGFKGEFWHNLDRPVGMRRKLVDTHLLKEWGWQAKTSLAEGIEKTYQFYLEQIKK